MKLLKNYCCHLILEAQSLKDGEKMQKIVKGLLCFLLILTLTYQDNPILAYSKTASHMEQNNLPPLASINLNKKRMIDINIVNDGTTGYSSATINSKINEILKPKLAQEGIDFDINVFDSAPEGLYPDVTREWTTIYKGSTSINNFSNFAIYQDGNGYALISYNQHTGQNTAILALPTLDFSKYKYTFLCTYQYGSNNYSTSITLDEMISGKLYLYAKCDTMSDVSVKITSTPVLAFDTLKTVSFNTGKNYYPMNKTGPYNSTISIGGSVSGNITYVVLPENKIRIKSWSLDNDSIANDRNFYINFYSGYNQKNLIRKTNIFHSKIGTALYSGEYSTDTTGSELIIDFNDIKDTVRSFSITFDASYTVAIPVYCSYALMQDGNTDSQWLRDYPLIKDEIKRKPYITESLNNTSWRDNAEKYYVDFSDDAYSESIYTKGKSDSLKYLSSNEIIPVKIGNPSRETDSNNFVKDNDNIGRFIDNTNLDAAIQDLTNYVLNRVKVNIELISNYNNVTEKAAINNIKAQISNKLNTAAFDTEINNYALQKSNPGIYPINRFYYTKYYSSSYQFLWYYDETDRKCVQTSIKFPVSTILKMCITPKGELVVWNGNSISIYVPTEKDIELIKNIDITISNYEALPQKINNKTYYNMGVSDLCLDADGKYAYVKYKYQQESAISGWLVNYDYKIYKFDIKTSTLKSQYLTDSEEFKSIEYEQQPQSSEVISGTIVTTYTLGTSKLGTYASCNDYIYTPDGNKIFNANATVYSLNDGMYIKYPDTELEPFSTATLTETIANIPDNDTTSAINYVVYISGNYLADTINTANLDIVISKLKSSNASFAGISDSNNTARINDIITANNSKGTYINNFDMDSAIGGLAEYIISTANAENYQLQTGSYVVVSENEKPIEFEAGGLDNTTGVHAVNPAAIRSREYLPAESNGSYTINENNSGIEVLKLYCYDSDLRLIAAPIWIPVNNRFTLPQNTYYIKVLCEETDTGKANRLALTDNNAIGGESVNYKPNVTDNENDTSDIIFKFDHDNRNVAGAAITNPSDKLSLSGAELSTPIERFTKPGTYNISMYAKDIPKQTADTSNLLPNGDAETVDPSGKLSDWSTWAETQSITTFTRRTTAPSKILGNGSFEISTAHGINNSACYYKDLTVLPNTSYKLNGLLAAKNCSAYFVIYELDNNNKILNTSSSNLVTNKLTAQSRSILFKTGYSTTRLRVYIVKGETESAEAADSLRDEERDYVFADNITLVKMLADSRFNEYRKTSKPVTAEIYAHRLPRAEFTYQIENTQGLFRIKDLEDNQLSYDPDHTDKSNKGIVNSQWRWAEITADGTTTWHDGKVPEAMSFAAGTQVLMWYRVQDTDGPDGIGAWSRPKVAGTDGSLKDPAALFTAAPNPLPMHKELTITDQSYTPNFGGTITSRIWTIKKAGETTAKILSFDRTDISNNKYYKKFTSLGFGKFTITLTVMDSYGRVSKPYSQTIDVIDTINPTVSASQATGTFDAGVADISINCADHMQGNLNNRGLKTIEYVWSRNGTEPKSTDSVQRINISTEGVYIKDFTTKQEEDGTWYLYVKDTDYAGNTNNGDSYTRFGPYTVQTVKAGNFYITMMLDINWRSYYFDVDNGIDDNHDGKADRYPRRLNTDISTLKLPINYYNLVGYERTCIKAGYKVKGRIDIIGAPDWAGFNINYIIKGRTCTDTVALTKTAGDTYSFEWIIPSETDSKSFIGFDLVLRKGAETYGNEKWTDTWDSRNTARKVFYVDGRATDDFIYVQSH
jgi:hypothetical protein